MESTPRYEVWFDGKLFDTLSFNMRGYLGYLPCPPNGGRFHVGERSISFYRKAVAQLNREFKEHKEPNLETTVTDLLCGG
jgi:hypothetical protein